MGPARQYWPITASWTSPVIGMRGSRSPHQAVFVAERAARTAADLDLRVFPRQPGQEATQLSAARGVSRHQAVAVTQRLPALWG
jgi:hypothetical protein